MNLPEIPFDCEAACICERDFALCPNVQAFGAMALEFATQKAKPAEQSVEIPKTDTPN